MKVRTRLILLGAVVPVAALVIVATVAGVVLERRMHAELDSHLLAQAAVESIGLFDGEDGEPHLHAHRSPLRADLHGLIPVGAIYRDDGEPVVRTHGDETAVPPRLRARLPLGEIEMRTEPAAGATAERRELITAVTSPAGTRYTLYLAVSTDRLHSTMRGYWVAAGVAVAAVGALLAAVQTLLASRLARRVGRLAAYLPRLREGQSSPPPEPDPTGDELAALRDGLHEAACALERSRAERERGLAAAAHDLRTPLGVIRATIDLALRRPRSGDELKAALGEVRSECDRLTALTDSILAERRGARSPSPLDLRPLLDDAVHSMAPLAAEHGVTLEASGGPARVVGDPAQLRRIIDNLLHNALTHSPRGGKVRLALEPTDEHWRLEVVDQGPGIAEDQRERVFQPFVHGAESRGAGLGLSIVRQIAAEHGGSAWAKPGPGGRIVVEIPHATSDHAPGVS